MTLQAVFLLLFAIISRGSHLSDVVVIAANGVYKGDFGGIAAADAICQSDAASANRPETFIAFLAGTERDDLSVLFDADAKVIDRNGNTLFNSYSDIFVNDVWLTGTFLRTFDNTRFDEDYGSWDDADAWTGASSIGQKTDFTCSDWTTTSGTGTNTELDQDYEMLKQEVNSCNSDFGILCVGGDILQAVCQVNEYVSGGTCVACPTGTSNTAGDNPSGSNTYCNCDTNYHVQSNVCVACPSNSVRDPGDDPTSSDTSCMCSANHHVVSNVCIACPVGSDRPEGDDMAGADTLCNCMSNYHVQSNVCTACPVGMVRDAGDDSTGSDTACEHYCANGIAERGVCCHSSCGSCAGVGCSDRVGGLSSCCRKQIRASGVQCTSSTTIECNLPADAVLCPASVPDGTVMHAPSTRTVWVINSNVRYKIKGCAQCGMSWCGPGNFHIKDDCVLTTYPLGGNYVCPITTAEPSSPGHIPCPNPVADGTVAMVNKQVYVIYSNVRYAVQGCKACGHTWCDRNAIDIIDSCVISAYPDGGSYDCFEHEIINDVVIIPANGIYNGNLGGIAGADTICQADAISAGRSEQFIAFLAGTERPQLSTLFDSDARVVDSFGRVMFDKYSDIFVDSAWSHGNHIYTFDGSEFDDSPVGNWDDADAWTGADSSGNKKSATCSDWASTSGSGTATEMDIGMELLKQETRGCSAGLGVICVGQASCPASVSDGTIAKSGKTIFVINSNTRYAIRGCSQCGGDWCNEDNISISGDCVLSQYPNGGAYSCPLS